MPKRPDQKNMAGNQQELPHPEGIEVLTLTGAALEDYRAYAGDGIFRMSVGLEDAEDLIADLDRALA